jgi:hypothetical protein
LASEQAAAATYDAFDDRYLGAKSSNPTVDNDGDPLVVGALHFNTVANEMRVYDGAVWRSAGSTVNGTAIRQSFTATNGQTTFTVAGGYDAGFADVYLNGVKLVNGVDVIVTSGTDVVLVVGATAGDSVDVIAYGAFLVANTYTQAQTDALLATKVSTSAIGVTVQGFDAATAKTNAAQTFTASQRGTVTADNDLSFDLSVTNNFSCTPTGAGTLTFTNRTAGQSGFVLLINTGGHTISAHANTKVSATALATISAAGTYLLSYFTDGSNTFVVNSGALA